jgi:type I restriction enzyme R subunit
LLPTDDFRSFKSNYLDTAKRLKAMQDKGGASPEVEQLDFEFVLFSSAIIDYDYIIGLMAKNMHSKPSSKQKMTKEQIINLLSSSANMQDERDDIIAYINALQIGDKLTEDQIKKDFQAFKDQKANKELNTIAQNNGITTESLKAFIDDIMDRMIFDGEKLTDLLAPLELGWKDRKDKEEALMQPLIPVLHKLAQGREIAGLNAYE